MQISQFLFSLTEHIYIFSIYANLGLTLTIPTCKDTQHKSSSLQLVTSTVSFLYKTKTCNNRISLVHIAHIIAIFMSSVRFGWQEGFWFEPQLRSFCVRFARVCEPRWFLFPPLFKDNMLGWLLLKFLEDTIVYNTIRIYGYKCFELSVGLESST